MTDKSGNLDGVVPSVMHLPILSTGMNLRQQRMWVTDQHNYWCKVGKAFSSFYESVLIGVTLQITSAFLPFEYEIVPICEGG